MYYVHYTQTHGIINYFISSVQKKPKKIGLITARV